MRLAAQPVRAARDEAATVSTRPIAELKADAENPRTIDDSALTGLGVSLEDFGDLSGIVFNKRTGELTAGHQRVDRLRAAGATEWTTLEDGTAFVVHPTTGERFPVRIVDWPIEKQRAANLVANNPTIQGAFDARALAQLEDLREHVHAEALRLPEMQAQIQRELDRLLRLQKAKEGRTDPDEAAEPPEVPTSKLGDLYILGEHRLLCGDSANAEHVARLMDGRRAVMMATDPPYGVAYTDEVRVAAERAHGRQQRSQKWDVSIDNDEKTGADIQPFLEAMFHAAAPALELNAAWYLWHAQMTQGFFAAAAAAANLVLHRQIIWVKPSLLFGFGDYHWRHELCFYGWVKGNRPPFYGERNQTTIWEFGNETSAAKRCHPTQKPVQIFQIPMGNHTRPSEVCYEPFSGSGSQIIAGQMLERRVFAMEVDPRYVDAAVARWEAFTGKTAERQPA